MCVTCSAEEEINNMKLELDKYGIQMPAFSKIGGILANELSVDEAAGKAQACTATLSPHVTFTINLSAKINR